MMRLSFHTHARTGSAIAASVRHSIAAPRSSLGRRANAQTTPTTAPRRNGGQDPPPDEQLAAPGRA